MEDTWTQLVRLKMAEDRLNELKQMVWESMPYDGEMQVSLEAAEIDLAEIKQLIEINNPIRKMD